MIRFVDLDTDEVVDREMNAAEYKQFEADQAKYQAEETEAETKAIAKSALLDRLGITEDEAKLFLS